MTHSLNYSKPDIFPVKNRVSSSAELAISQSSRMKNKSHMSMLNNNSPSIEPWGTADIFFCHELHVSDVWFFVYMIVNNYK